MGENGVREDGFRYPYRGTGVAEGIFQSKLSPFDTQGSEPYGWLRLLKGKGYLTERRNKPVCSREWKSLTGKE